MESQRLPRIGQQVSWIATVIGSVLGKLCPSFLVPVQANLSGASKPTFYNRNKDQVVNARLHAAGTCQIAVLCFILGPN